ncbi:hypothetical protein Micbo1qcDRAFT_196213 [Microdochium bolleyi]|uniref:Polynucleotide 5'-hydroxyl-kinase GRC3 n=1 Tax=Microdochium bolleyi TaxID=196109 RepID=A0A136J128_9PEZI|nr:hypothetical protein Micbo1qcDRAFT_196213 [Microdochium bolleyi]
MSAFAFRKRLLGSQDESSSSDSSPNQAATATAAASSVQGGQSPKTSASRQKRARKDGPRSDAKQAAAPPIPRLEEPVSVLATAQSLGQPDPDAVGTPPLDATPAATPTRTPAVFFSTYTPTQANYRRWKDGTAVVTLCEGERLVILGSYGVRVRSGKITINGATLVPRSSSAWVDAPGCYALPVIRTVDDSVVELHPYSANRDIRGLASISPLFRGLWLDDDGSTFRIVPTSLDGPKKTVLQDLVSLPEWNREAARLSQASSSRAITIMVTGPKSSGKSTFGKMLANRIITESAAEKAPARNKTGLAILDLDPGQPEYGVPGQVSLVHILEPVLSPSFTRPTPLKSIRTIRAHTLASISPASDPELYLEAAKDLYTHYRNTIGSSTLIINTPGWIQGTGLDLLVSLIADLRPSEVVYMSQTGPSESVEGLSSACRNTTFTLLPSNATALAARSAAQLRSMQLLSYFHVEPTEHKDQPKRGPKTGGKSSPQPPAPYSWITTPLSQVPPWEVSYGSSQGRGSRNSAAAGIAGILCYDYQAPPALLADAINGNIVAVVEVEDIRAFRGVTPAEEQRPPATRTDDEDVNVPTTDMDIDSPPALSSLIDSSTIRTPEGLPLLDTRGATLDPQYSRFVGLALVRGIDTAKHALQLISPIPAGELDRIFGASEELAGQEGGRQIVLISGKFDTPSWAYTEDFYYQASSSSASLSWQSRGGGPGQGDAVATEGVEPDFEEEEEEVEEDGEFDISFDAVETEPSVSTTPIPAATATDTPWIEELRGSQKRGIGSKVWRVRRDLGRSNNGGE